ncbi:MAG TPA: terminase family protein, partial [Ktedonobacterales bacterium]|nr:terminase family protein [Ktedonobacterales bacterium]
ACLLDPAVFATRAGFTPDAWQARALRSTASRMLLLASRQSGKSSTVALIAAHTALYEPGALVLIVAPVERQSGETFRKVVGVFHALGWPVPSTSLGTMHLQLANGSRVIALPGSGQTIRGYSGPRLLLLDEAAQIPDELLQAVFPMLSVSQGRLLALSTPFGMRGWFYDAWIGDATKPDAAAEATPWERYHVPASQCPRITPAIIAEALRTFGPDYVASEYNCEFKPASGSLFNAAEMAAAVKEYEQPWNLSQYMPAWISPSR